MGKTTCQICGKEYDYCPNCDKVKNWRRYACTPEHYQIVMILTEYREGVIDAKEATECFANIGITANSELDLLDAVTRDIKAIIEKGTPKRVPKPKAKSEESIIEDTDE